MQKKSEARLGLLVVNSTREERLGVLDFVWGYSQNKCIFMGLINVAMQKRMFVGSAHRISEPSKTEALKKNRMYNP